VTNKHYKAKDVSKMLDELLDYDGDTGNRPLTDWEMGFIDSMRSKRESEAPHGPLFTINQAAKLVQIWNETLGEA
jgi:hypothetical protein